MRTILFGGSFNPLHLGHIAAAESALSFTKANRVLFVPAPKPFDKPDYTASAEDRLTMMERALVRYPWAHICLYEIQDSLLGKPPVKHYTIDTLHFLLENNQVEKKPYLLVGDDLLEHFFTWKDYKKLAQETSILIASRYEQLQHTPDFPFTLLKNVPCPYAASNIRNFIALGKSYRKFVPKEVYTYIERKKLYRSF